MDQFKTDYKSVVVTDVVPNYTDILRKSHAAQKAVETGRQPDFDRTADHGARMASFRDLRECCNDLAIAREEVNKKIARENKADRVAVWTLRIGILTLIVAVMIAIWTASGFWTPWRHAATPAPPEAGSARRVLPPIAVRKTLPR